MITFSKLGAHGRMGNQLWQVASMIGISRKYNVDVIFPAWKYESYFKGVLPHGSLDSARKIEQPDFHYDPSFLENLDWSEDYDFLGYFQSPKFFDKDEIRELFSFKDEVISRSRSALSDAFKKKTIGIHARRTDYVGNPNYINLPALYYILALEQEFPDWRNCNLIFFSDDISWLKIHFQCLPNAFFSEGLTDIEDFCLFSQCDNFIISNSSFAFWAAFLGEKSGTKVVRPARHFSGGLEGLSIDDLYPEQWIALEWEDRRIDLRDVTFTIPVAYDHSDRKQNLDLIVCLLQKVFDTHIVIGEQGGDFFEYMSQWCEYRRFDMGVFHRTKMLNDMARDAKTKFVANYDCDVTLPPMQILQAVHKLRNGADITSPYDGGFAGVPRNPWFRLLEKHLDVGIFGNAKFRGKGINPNSGDAYGGAVFANRESYIRAGMENENYISWSAEDSERWLRFTKLGLRIERVGGFIYHIDHWRGPDSSRQNPYWQAGEKESEKIRSLDKEGLQEYIKTWKWINY